MSQNAEGNGKANLSWDARLDCFLIRIDGFFDRKFGVGQYTPPAYNAPAAAASQTPAAGTTPMVPATNGTACAVNTCAPAYINFQTPYQKPFGMTGKQKRAYELYLEDTPGVTKYVLNSLVDSTSRPAGITDEDLARVAKHVRETRELTRTKTVLRKTPENIVYMEDGNRGIYYNGKETVCDGAEVMIYPLSMSDGKPIYGLGTAATVKMYKSDTVAGFSSVDISDKLAKKFFGPSYLSTKLDHGLTRGLPLKIELLKGGPVVTPQTPKKKRPAKKRAPAKRRTQLADLKPTVIIGIRQDRIDYYEERGLLPGR